LIDLEEIIVIDRSVVIIEGWKRRQYVPLDMVVPDPRMAMGSEFPQWSLGSWQMLETTPDLSVWI